MFAPILAICDFRVVRTPEKSLSPPRRQRAIGRVSERSRLVVATVDEGSDNECEVLEELKRVTEALGNTIGLCCQREERFESGWPDLPE